MTTTKLRGPDRSVPLTLQHYYKETIWYLRNQPKASTVVAPQGGPGDCRYRGEPIDPDEPGVPNCCAIGWWIPDEDYDPAMESESADELADRLHLRGVAIPNDPHGPDLAGYLQSLHDEMDNRGPATGGLSPAGEREAASVAARFGLVYTPPPEVSP